MDADDAASQRNKATADFEEPWTTKGSSAKDRRKRNKKEKKEPDEDVGLKRNATLEAFGFNRDEEWKLSIEDVGEDLNRRMKEAVVMPAVLHIDHGQFDMISLKDIEALFDKLGTNDKGQLEMFKLEALLEVKVVPPFTASEVDVLFEGMCGVRNDKDDYKKKFIYAQELLTVFNSRTPQIDKLMEARRAKEQFVTRDYFVDYVHNTVDRNDAFMTLPITLVYLLLFVYLVQKHLQIFDRRLLENSVEEFINGRDPRETADENIDDMDSYWEWVTDAGLRGPFGNVQNSSDNRFKVCILASRNILIGDVRLTKKDFDGKETSAWLLGSTVGQAYLAANPHEYQAAAVASANNLKDNGWSSPDIEAMWMSFVSYNEMSKMFAITNVYVPLPRLGNVFSRIDSAAVSIEPYPSIDLYVVDGLFFLLAAYICYNEMKDLIDACRLGFDELLDYWGFWNAVDWLNILFFILFAFSWYITVVNMLDDSHNSLLKDYVIDVDVMRLDTDRCGKILDQLTKLRRCYLVVQITMALNTLFVVVKFFKSFNANARLRVVTDTFRIAGEDLIHFGIMFTTIFLPFTIIGHILFGSDIQEFSSITSSINLGITCLMGDFVWYVEDSPSNLGSVLPSGMPKIVLMLWYVTFMFLVFLVLLNMLLAVILQHYTDVAEKVAWSKEAESIWVQAKNYWRQRKETRGFISLEFLRNCLEDDDNATHQESSVTINSLLRARWPNSESGEVMSEAQASYLLTKLEERSKEEKELGEIEEKNKHTRFLAEANKEGLLELAENLTDNKERLDQLEGVSSGFSSIVDGLNDMSRIVTSLKSSVSKLRKEQDRLSGKVDDMLRQLPEESRPEAGELDMEENLSFHSVATAKQQLVQKHKNVEDKKPKSRDDSVGREAADKADKGVSSWKSVASVPAKPKSKHPLKKLQSSKSTQNLDKVDKHNKEGQSGSKLKKFRTADGERSDREVERSPRPVKRQSMG